MITEDYVNFETAKLLKEKGFDGECRDYYNTDGHFYSEDFSSNWNDPRSPILQLVSAPTLQMAMKWLREKHKLFTLIEYSTFSFDEKRPFVWSIRYQKVDGDYIGGTHYGSYEKACEAAIQYCLQNLI